MKKTISAYEAPALLDAHPTMTRLALYERLSGGADTTPQAGLASFLADRVIEFAASDNDWTNPIRRDFRKGVEDGLAIDGFGRAWRMSDGAGEFVAVFTHLAAFLHSQTWSKAGAPPEAFIIQANWTMYMADAARLAYVVLADKRLIIYWVDRDDQIVQRLVDAVSEMAIRIEQKQPPAIDAVVDQAPIVIANDDAPGELPPADLDALAARWRATKLRRSTAHNEVETADHAYEAAAAALLKAIPQGSHHDSEGVRIHHNAKSGRLIEEKIDGAYF